MPKIRDEEKIKRGMLDDVCGCVFDMNPSV